MNDLFHPLLKQSFQSTGIYLLIIALTLAISATTALKFSNQQIQNAVTLQAAEMLAGDLLLSDNQPIPNEWRDQATQLGLEQSEVTVFSSMASTSDKFVMVNVKAVDTHFPLRGEITVSPSQKGLNAGEIWLSPRAMQLLKVNIGDQVQIADASFQLSAEIVRDSNQELGFGGFSPTVMIAQSEVARTNAIQVGSRIDYRLLLAGTPQQTQRFEHIFRTKFPDQQELSNQEATIQSLKLRNAAEGNSRLIKPIANLDTFLQLANILTILLCGIAIALTAQRYVQQNQDHIALMRCMGASRQQILKAYVVLLVLIIAIAIVLGTVIGIGLGFGLLQLMMQLIPNLIITFSVKSLIVGPLPIAILTSAVVLIGFVLPNLWQLMNTAPIRVIRQQEKSVHTLLWTLATGLVSLIMFSLILTENIVLSAWVMGAIILLCAVLYLTVWLFLRGMKQLKLGASAYIRTPSQTALQITALALGLSLISVLVVLRTDLLERWQQQLPEGTPNQFVYGLPPFEMPELAAKLKQNQWESTPLYPNIRGRLVEKNGKAFSADLVRTNNTLQRELNLTQSDTYPKDNVILKGEPLLKHPGEVSVEAKTAQELGIQIGDRLTFNLPEGPLQAKVVNLRSVEWESFSPNFFFIFHPKTMDVNAGSYLGSFYVPEVDKPKLINLIQQFATTVFIDVSLILDEVKRIVNVLVQVVTLLALLVSISGFLVLIACLNLLMDERKKEVALLRAFGSSKTKIKSMLTLEIGCIGFISGVVACVFAEIISAVASYKMELSIQLHYEIWVVLPLLMTLLCALIGRYRLSYLAQIPPLQSLREIGQ
ncbi:ABC transporter permease [Acinetobacter sp. NCu2D-2]|uniref:ABC transporter permease n=1 Tax=Acinetobacter sp. NCu2D-2 TaxID=1608473 RepID=UPI0007CDEFD3|nr:FtsX-like permease family protein [Acinetobacter sp. NCu2D-2]ANF81327.1 ABC transporter permease [Acinetobacter sp. NCu2D-2]